ncbi:MAG TPA: hypothetical protein VFB68_10780 [Xanthobacteraceae bacterium]|nr:hypothetical protein [Xanthobacteraceae bacterium]
MSSFTMSSFMPLLLELIVKMTATAAVVVAASVVAERSGPFIGAMVAALPTAAGAAYVILAIEHPPSFIAASAIGSIAANAAVVIFAFTYAVLAQRRSLIASLGGALVVWLACAALLRTVDWTVPSVLVLSVVVFGVVIPANARYRIDSNVKVKSGATDIAWRALAVSVCVVVVTAASHSIGSFASGIFALFPVVISSVLVIIQLRLGGPAAASVAAHVGEPLIGLSLGFLAVHYLAEPAGVWWAFAAGVAVCFAWSGVLWLLRQRKRVSRTA